MEIIENGAQWEKQFKETWLAHYEETGETNWKIYNRPDNKTAPSGKGIDLSKSKLMLISSAGAYLPASQERYDDENDLGDYSTRIIPMDIGFDELEYAHTHYDHTAVNTDPQVLVPLEHLKTLVKEGVIGSLADDWVSFMGYQPYATRVVNETIPAILAAVKQAEADAVLLVPS